jgi:phosphoserine phosphatase
MLREITVVTERAMRGEIPLESIFAERLARIRPTRDEIAALGEAYVEGMAPAAAEVCARLMDAGVRAVIVSGGLRQAVLVLAGALGIAEPDVHAVNVEFDDAGEYVSFDRSSPLARSGGKPVVVRGLDLEPPCLAIGDGSTDLELRTVQPPAVDSFVAFTGVATRPPVVAAADRVVGSLTDLLDIVLS